MKSRAGKKDSYLYDATWIKDCSGNKPKLCLFTYLSTDFPKPQAVISIRFWKGGKARLAQVAIYVF